MSDLNEIFDAQPIDIFVIGLKQAFYRRIDATWSYKRARRLWDDLFQRNAPTPLPKHLDELERLTTGLETPSTERHAKTMDDQRRVEARWLLLREYVHDQFTEALTGYCRRWVRVRVRIEPTRLIVRGIDKQH